MHTLIVILHVVVSIAMILVILLQTGKGSDIGAVFGGGSSQTLFGSTGPTSFLSKLTAGAAVLFMVTSLFLAYFSGTGASKSIMKGAPGLVVPRGSGSGSGRTSGSGAGAGRTRGEIGSFVTDAPRRASGKKKNPGGFPAGVLVFRISFFWFFRRSRLGDVGGLRPLRALRDLELDALAFLQ
jgi:preprotein translocase subunit SecG